jgi:hypothetical protein
MLVPTERGTSSSGSLNAKEPPSTRPRLGAVPEHVVAAPALLAGGGQTNVEGAPGSSAAGASPSRAPSSQGAGSSDDELVQARLQHALDELNAADKRQEVSRLLLLAAEKKSSRASHGSSQSRCAAPTVGLPVPVAASVPADPFHGLALGADAGTWVLPQSLPISSPMVGCNG